MTGAPSKPLPAPPAGPDDDARVLIDGDRCDAPRCPATAYVRIYMYRNGDKDNLAGLLHFCGHHWHEVADTFWLLSIQTRCGIIDETSWLEAHT